MVNKKLITLIILFTMAASTSVIATDAQNNAGKVLGPIGEFYQAQILANVPAPLQQYIPILALLAVFIVVYWYMNNKKKNTKRRK